MKKTLIIIMVFLGVLFPLKAFAAQDYTDQINDIADKYNVDTEQISDITLEDIWQYIKENVSKTASQPLKMFYRISAVIIIGALIKIFEPNFSSGITQLTDSLCTVVVFLSLINPFETMTQIVENNLFDIKNFMMSFLPLFSGISFASGEFVTSAIYTGFFLMALTFMANFCISTILPSLNLYLALAVTNSVSPFIRLKSLCDLYIKLVKWIMRSMVSIICFFLTVQTIITQGQDNLAVKASKAVVSVAIPVIGSSLQDAVSSVYAGMEAIKGFAGAVGIMAIFYIFMPSVILLVVYWMAANGLVIVCDILDQGTISGIIGGFIGVIELLLSIVFLFLIMIVFSLTIMIKLTQGV